MKIKGTLAHIIKEGGPAKKSRFPPGERTFFCWPSLLNNMSQSAFYLHSRLPILSSILSCITYYAQVPIKSEQKKGGWVIVGAHGRALHDCNVYRAVQCNKNWLELNLSNLFHVY